MNEAQSFFCARTQHVTERICAADRGDRDYAVDSRGAHLVCGRPRAERCNRERRSGSGGAGLGAAMQELDRLVARPSVEHTVEAENRVLRREDDAGDK